MSLHLFTYFELEKPILLFEPNQITMITKENFDILKSYGIEKLPAVVKCVSDKLTIIQGKEEIEKIKPLSLEEIATSIEAEKNK